MDPTCRARRPATPGRRGGAGPAVQLLVPYGRAMDEEAKRSVGEAFRLTWTVLGIGFIGSLVVGLIIGLLNDDVAGSLGRSVAIGMSITAVVCVATILIPRRGA